MTGPALQRLLQAKSHSDRGDYRSKHALLRQLLQELPNEFVVDSDQGRIVGITHPGTGFKIHLPAAVLPDVFRAHAQPQARPPARWPVKEDMLDVLGKVAPRVEALRKAAASALGEHTPYGLHYEADAHCLHLAHDGLPPAAVADFRRLAGVTELALDESPLGTTPPGPHDRPWLLVKKAYSPTLRGLTDLVALTPGPANAWYGGPRPLAAALAGGLLGAGAGYLGGAAAEGLLPETFRRGRLRRTLAALGGLAGSTPGLLWSARNVSREGLSGLLSPNLSGPDDSDPDPGPTPYPWPKEVRASCAHDYGRALAVLHKALPGCASTPLAKHAVFPSGGAGEIEPVDVDDFNQVVWSRHDPFTPVPVRAAASGLVEAAGMLRGSPLVTPGDIARVAAGMGSGYALGTLAGRTLGALAGLSPPAQQALQRAGTWAGVLKAVLPGALGG